MRKILIPTDFSENALNAIRYATELFKYERSEFLIFHAYADEVYDKNAHMARALFEDVKTQVHKSSDKKLEEILEKLTEFSPNPKHSYDTKSIFGTLIDEANKLVEKENIDILVMGTKGETNSTMTFGSNTLQVLKYVSCPVLAIPIQCFFKKPKNILFPTDYMVPYKRRELKLLSTLAKSFRSILNFLYLSNFEKLSIRQEDYKIFLEDCLTDISLIYNRVKGESIVDAINQFVTTNKMDMLVMINSRHSYLENMLYQSSIDTIGLHIGIPFLVLQNLQRN